jgi:hypothetical protein
MAEDARKAAVEVFEKDCLIRLGTCIAPIGKPKPGTVILTAEFELPGEGKKIVELKTGEIIVIPAPYQAIKAKLTPGKSMSIGKDKGEALETEIFGGTVGLILDGRGRPFELSTEKSKRIENLNKWSKATNEYPDTELLGGA